MINFTINKSGTVKGLQEFIAITPSGELLATISPRLEQSGRYSTRFLNVCFLDGKTEIAEGEEDASEVIWRKHSLRKGA